MRPVVLILACLLLAAAGCKKCVKCWYEYSYLENGSTPHSDSSYDEVACGNKKERAAFEEEWQQRADAWKDSLEKTPTFSQAQVELMCFAE